MTARPVTGNRAATALAITALLLLPLVLLWPCVFGDRTYVPYDLAQFPPASTQLTAEQLAAVRAGSNYDVTEGPIWFVPDLRLAHRIRADEGALPLWNPFARGGTVLQANGSDGLLYPPHWLALAAADPQRALVWLAVVNFAIAGLLAFGLLRHLGCSVLAALFGAITFACSGTACANAHFAMRLGSLVWLPGSLWAMQALARAEGWGRAWPMVALALTTALSWLAGFPPYSGACSLLVAALGTALAVQRWRRDGSTAALRLLGTAAIGGLLGLLLAGAHLLPAFAFFPTSTRAPVQSLREVSHNVFDWYGLLGYLLPDLFGHPSDTSLPYDKSPLPLWLGTHADHDGKVLLPNYNYTEYAVFPGTLGLLLAMLGATAGGARARLPLLAAAGLLLLAAFVPPLHWLFALPGMRALPPLRFLGPVSLFVAWLAAIGLDSLRQANARRRAVIAGSLALALAGASAFAAHSAADPALFDRLDLAGSLATHYRSISQTPESVTPESVRNEFMRAPDGGSYFDRGRVRAASECERGALWLLLGGAFLFAASALRGRATTPWLVLGTALGAAQLLAIGRPLDAGKELTHPLHTTVQDFLAAQRLAHAAEGGFTIARAATTATLPTALPPSSLYALGIRDLQVDSYFDQHSAELLKAWLGPEAAGKGYVEKTLVDGPGLQLPLLDLLSVRFLLATERLAHAGVPVHELHGPGGDFLVYERTSALPRAFVVPSLQPVADDQAAIAALLSPTLQPRASAVITPDEAADLPAVAEDAGAAARAVRFVVDHSSEVVLEIAAGPPGYLVLADTWAAGWTAACDDRPVAIARVNQSMRAVALPADACRVRFAYRAPGLFSGALVSLLAALVLAGIAGARVASSRRHRRVDSPM
ncbi:MAG TPA: hypothetical protein VK348_08315 [Planctomycetota bacterium]|nr:hypothetical protein [Planctomycetota bacterium]